MRKVSFDERGAACADATKVTRKRPVSPPPSGVREPTWLRPGNRFGHGVRFELTELIGYGGVGRVFRVRDHQLERDVAAKFFVDNGAEDCMSSNQLLLEARVTARLSHPNLISVFDVGQWRTVPYFLMEYIEGTPLHEVLGGRPFAASRALSIVRQVALGIRHAHRAGVLHLDLKPSNIVLSDVDHVKIVDFGIAGCVPAWTESAESFVGTPAYMAPEQWSMRPLDERTDVWGVGLLLYEMLTGSVPGTGHCRVGLFSIEEEHRIFQLLPESELAASLSAVLRRACALKPDARFRDMDELLEALPPEDWQ
jgi:serine/threonine protein kinase